MDSMEPRKVIGIYHLSKRYGDRVVLRDVNLQVGNGEFVFLVGPSGAGKSTLLRMIYMDETPNEGQVVVGSFVSTSLKTPTDPAPEAQDRDHLPGLQAPRGPGRVRKRRDRDAGRRDVPNAEIKKRVIQVLTPGGSLSQTIRPAGDALRRRAAAGGDRSRDRQQPRDPSRGRAHGESRPRGDEGDPPDPAADQ